ncbi:creatine transporter-like [Watersipora subatra]|uniref:creatine transporter-like n=1 Tax=Watersipora subatra TaxID=2589382 RepID=UPI00355B25F5
MEQHEGFARLPTSELQESDEQADGIPKWQMHGSGLDSSDSENSSQKDKGRETWSHSAEFVLSCVGFAVGLGNIWRFPYLCYKNGGGVFLIPYLIFLVVGGVPVFFLEIAVGQFMRISGIKTWNFMPVMKGIGLATTVILALLNCYYIIILAWNGFYLADTLASIGGPLPWDSCNNSWNTETCKTEWFVEVCSYDNASSSEDGSLNGTVCEQVSNKGSDSVTEYWNHRILQTSESIEEPGGVVWQLALSLFVTWVVVYFCIWKGVKWTGKVVYFTATFPYLVITILLVRGLTLEGAGSGLIYYLKPDITRLSDINVWVDAGTQIFYSYAVAIGALTALGSYNKFNNNCHRQVLILAGVNSGTSLYAGMAIFSVLGYMAQEQGVHISNVTDKGAGLAFIAYPKATSTMPFAPHLWAVLFFIMIVFVGLDSQFVSVEAFVTIIADAFPKYLRKPWRRELFAAGYCFLTFIIGLSMVTNGGIYVFELFNYYSASGMSLLWVSFFECAAVAWLYGSKKFYGNLEAMMGFKLLPWFRICWLVLSPLASALLFVMMWVEFEPLKYADKYTYPAWAQAIGICMAFASMLCIPGYAVYEMVKAPGSLTERWAYVRTPVLGEEQLKATATCYEMTNQETGKSAKGNEMMRP